MPRFKPLKSWGHLGCRTDSVCPGHAGRADRARCNVRIASSQINLAIWTVYRDTPAISDGIGS